MIRNIKTNNYIKFNSSHFKNLYNKQLVGSDHYFLSKDVKAISSAYKNLKKNTKGLCGMNKRVYLQPLLNEKV